MTELFLQTLPVVTSLSVRECELLKEEWQENLLPQLEKWENHRQRRWKLFQEQLLHEKEVRSMLCFEMSVSKKGDTEKIIKVLTCGECLMNNIHIYIYTLVQTQL